MNLSEERVGLIAYEIGGAVMHLVEQNIIVSQDSIASYLEMRREMVSGAAYKCILRDAAEVVKGGKYDYCRVRL
ncbi:hypothetical protein I2494_18080 [Budviciaceae bacterium BWR-B9]|uniref:Uncharacterized protein n=1 Tax=Limnobaculum allomyrinae TaxID=2791986 RepID=A0ABS1IV19_9GAMM|nr:MULTISPECIES: hypothetical protein [Limnobaculum]MBK5145588.1 hypothetical protein [Limnobaculum allomyrinae]MBV7693707.1 hypothetical protein [Limnobaculum sp. M2-1]